MTLTAITTLDMQVGKLLKGMGNAYGANPQECAPPNTSTSPFCMHVCANMRMREQCGRCKLQDFGPSTSASLPLHCARWLAHVGLHVCFSRSAYM